MNACQLEWAKDISKLLELNKNLAIAHIVYSIPSKEIQSFENEWNNTFKCIRYTNSGSYALQAGDLVLLEEGIDYSLRADKLIIDPSPDMKEDLAKTKANLTSIFESTTSMIALFDKNKLLLEFNQNFARYAQMTDGFDVEYGMDILSKFPKPVSDLFHANMDRALSDEKFSITIDYPTPDKMMYFALNYNPVYDENHNVTGLSLFIEDITALKESQIVLEKYATELEAKVEERTKELDLRNKELLDSNTELGNTVKDLKETQAQLIQSEKLASLGLVSAGIGHELNNPLNFIKNGAEALKVELQSDKDEKKIDQLLGIIDNGVQRASDIIKSLSLYSRNVEGHDEKCDLNDIIENSLLILNSKSKNRIAINKELSDKQLQIKGNQGQLHQVFTNIISNAIDAIEGNGNINITSKKSGKNIEIEIKDDGSGIEEENLNKIGEPFYTTKDPGKGTGLGMYITFQIVKEHNGRLKIDSKKGEGTLVKIIFAGKS